MSLVRNPRFAGAVNDIVVETGNALYQDVMDRFVNGESVPEASLRRIWQNTTQPFATFDVPVYEQFFRAVRDTNARLPKSKRLRVLLGDPPLDWSRVTAEDRSEWNRAMAERDSFPAALIRREVLAKEHRALVIYGGMHLQRRVIAYNFESPDDPARHSIVQAIQPSTELFSIWTNTAADLATLQPDIAMWHRPSLALTRNSMLGAADFTFYSASPQDRQAVRNGSLVGIPRNEWKSLRMEDQFDAVLYLGPPSAITFSRISRQLCADPSYLDMRMARFALVGLPRSAEQLRQECLIQ
jgi:hypothetical protein